MDKEVAKALVIFLTELTKLAAKTIAVIDKQEKKNGR